MALIYTAMGHNIQDIGMATDGAAIRMNIDYIDEETGEECNIVLDGNKQKIVEAAKGAQ